MYPRTPLLVAYEGDLQQGGEHELSLELGRARWKLPQARHV